jgi:hypothetical protein
MEMRERWKRLGGDNVLGYSTVGIERCCWDSLREEHLFMGTVCIYYTQSGSLLMLDHGAQQ